MPRKAGTKSVISIEMNRQIRAYLDNLADDTGVSAGRAVRMCIERSLSDVESILRSNEELPPDRVGIGQPKYITDNLIESMNVRKHVVPHAPTVIHDKMYLGDAPRQHWDSLIGECWRCSVLVLDGEVPDFSADEDHDHDLLEQDEVVLEECEEVPEEEQYEPEQELDQLEEQIHEQQPRRRRRG